MCSLPDGFGDDLIIEVQDSKGKYCGHALVQVADIADESVLYLDLVFGLLLFLKQICLCVWRGQVFLLALMQGEKHRQCIISREPEHEQVGKIQLHINYSTTADENSYKVYADVLCFMLNAYFVQNQDSILRQE